MADANPNAAKAKGMLAEFQAFLAKTNAIAIAIGIVVGIAVSDLVKGVVACFIQPLIDEVHVGSGVGFTLWVFKIGDFIGVAINFVVIMAVLFAGSKAFMKEEKKA